MEKKILIIGSNGILGKYLVKKLIHSFGIDKLVISDYKEERLKEQSQQLLDIYGARPLSRIINVHAVDSIEKGLKDIDLVFVAIQQKKPFIQNICIQKNINSIDLSVNPEFLKEVRALNHTGESLQLITGGLFPGLSGILAKESFQRSKENNPIDVGLLQSSNGTNGKTGVADMLKIFDQDVVLLTKENSKIHSGFTHKKSFAFPEPFGIKTLRLTHFVEKEFMLENGIKTNYWTSFDKESLNQFLGILKKMRFLKLFNNSKTSQLFSGLISKQNKSDKPELIALSVFDSANKLSLILTSDYEATAACAIGFAKLIKSKKPDKSGVRFPFELFTFEDIKKHIQVVTVDIYN
jgi:saccharopine dehydrogenase-like NADP-dependent oxidoreductase